MNTFNGIFNIKHYTFTKMNWTELIGGASMAAVIRGAFDLVKGIRRQRRNIPSNSLLKVTDIYSKCMKPVLNNTTAQRFTISKVEDSGGPLIPGADVFVSIVYEDYEKPLEPISDMFQRWRADKTYIEILHSVCENGSAAVDIEKLPESSPLRAMYAAQNIKYCEFFFVAQTKIKLFIAIISTKHEDQFKSVKDRSEIVVGINNLRNIFAEYYAKA